MSYLQIGEILPNTKGRKQRHRSWQSHVQTPSYALLCRSLSTSVSSWTNQRRSGAYYSFAAALLSAHQDSVEYIKHSTALFFILMSTSKQLTDPDICGENWFCRLQDTFLSKSGLWNTRQPLKAIRTSWRSSWRCSQNNPYELPSTPVKADVDDWLLPFSCDHRSMTKQETLL